jgi:hypothetical protein
MYGVERAVVALARAVGRVDGRAMLADSGRVGVGAGNAVVLRSGPLGAVMFSGKSHAV